jgi:hypothetical protein
MSLSEKHTLKVSTKASHNLLYFTPWHEISVRGFERLIPLPDWYVSSFVSISFSMFGITQLFK